MQHQKIERGTQLLPPLQILESFVAKFATLVADSGVDKLP